MPEQTNLPAETIFIELDEKSQEFFYDNAAKWFDNLLLAQSSYRKLLEDTAEKVKEFHIRAYLEEMAARAKVHEEKVEALYSLVHRDSSSIRKTLGTIVGKARQGLGDLMALTGGVAGPWQDLHQLFLANTNTMSAFGVAEQIGLAIGLTGIVDISFPIVMEKSTDHLLLQELALEMAGVAIVYNEKF